MATQLFLREGQAGVPYQYSSGTNSAKLDGTTSGWELLSLVTARGPSLVTISTGTVAGPTSGVEITGVITARPAHWISAPLSAAVTIAGTITFNLWASEVNMADNVAINVAIDRIDSTGAIVSRVVTTARVTEVAVQPNAVNNFTATPTSTAFLKGDRIRVRVFSDDAGTMGAGGTTNFGFGGPTAGANGDSYVTFTETFGFLTTDPATATVYPTDTASDIDPGGAGTDTKEAWTSRGAGVQSKVTSVGTGAPAWITPKQATASSGGNLIEWFTKPLTAFTLSGPVLVNVWMNATGTADNIASRVEIAITASDGTGATVWAATSHPSAMSGTEAAYTFYVAGDDLAVTNGQRIRLRFYFDDSSDGVGVFGPTNSTLYYAGTSGGASGDTFLTFGQTLTEYVAAAKAIPLSRNDGIYIPAHMDSDPWALGGWL